MTSSEKFNSAVRLLKEHPSILLLFYGTFLSIFAILVLFGWFPVALGVVLYMYRDTLLFPFKSAWKKKLSILTFRKGLNMSLEQDALFYAIGIIAMFLGSRMHGVSLSYYAMLGVWSFLLTVDMWRRHVYMTLKNS